MSHTEIASIIIDEVTGGEYKNSYIHEVISTVNPHSNISALSFAILSQNNETAVKLINNNA